MLKKETRKNIKTGAYIISSIGIGVLFGSVGGILINKIGGSVLRKGLCLIGISCLSGKVSKDVANSVEEDLDNMFDSLDEIEAKANNKEYKSA